MNLIKKILVKWNKLAEIIGNFNFKVILTIFYFTIIIPFAIIVKFFTAPLMLKHKGTSNWINVEFSPKTLEDFKKQ